LAARATPPWPSCRRRSRPKAIRSASRRCRAFSLEEG
jgi:hypothetical protein